jgi:hypothetical protein
VTFALVGDITPRTEIVMNCSSVSFLARHEDMARSTFVALGGESEAKVAILSSGAAVLK